MSDGSAPAGQKFLTWDIHYACNYHCPYCFLENEPETKGIAAAYLKKDEWARIWNGLYDRYGSFQMSVTGGEPFTYPDFIDLVADLAPRHTFEFSTNLSWDVRYFAKKISPQRVKINSSFHPDCVSKDEFLEKIVYLKYWGFQTSITVVAYPPLLGKIEGYNDFFKNTGQRLILYPFRGPYSGRTYPDGYTAEERTELKKLGLDLGAGVNRELFQRYDVEKKKPAAEPAAKAGAKKTAPHKERTPAPAAAAKVCRNGQLYAKLVPDGEAYRCCAAVNKQWGRLGNIVKGTFSLSLEAEACPDITQCRCYKAMVIGDEKKWEKDWLTVTESERQEQERRLLEKAKRMRDAGEIEGAVEAVAQFLRNNPGEINALTLMAEFKLGLKEYAACEETLEGVLKTDPNPGDHSWIYRILGKANLEKAAADPERRAEFLERAGLYLSRSVEAANNTNNLSDRAAAHCELAVFHLRNGYLDKSRAEVASALLYEPKNGYFLQVQVQIEEAQDRLWFGRYEAAQQLGHSGKTVEAITELKVILGHKPKFTRARIQLAEFYLRLGDHYTCEEMLSAISAGEPEAEIFGWLYRVYGELYKAKLAVESSAAEREHLTGRARDCLRKAIECAKQSNDNASVGCGYYRLAELEFSAENRAEARENIARALEVEPENPSYLELGKRIPND
jgi:MoaA/NifB/PqqE/SkfB family radical SAM enzyme/predicted Zn-dependent protease